MIPEIHEIHAAPEKLAEAKPDCGAMQLSEQLSKKIDEATTHIINELHQLKEEIEKIEAKVIEDAGLVKTAVGNHFALGAEALAWRTKVSKRLADLAK